MRDAGEETLSLCVKIDQIRNSDPNKKQSKKEKVVALFKAAVKVQGIHDQTTNFANTAEQFEFEYNTPAEHNAILGGLIDAETAPDAARVAAAAAAKSALGL